MGANRTAWILTITAMMASPGARALQMIDARDGVSVEAILSIKEPTRIRIEGGPITDVFGNVQSNHCGTTAALPATPGISAPASQVPATNSAGELIIECDRDKGEIYVRPVGESAKPVNLFVSSANATYTLLLRRADVPADTIVIRDHTPKALKSPTAQAPVGPAPNPVRAMKAMLVAMASDLVPPDIQVEETHAAVPLWAEARFTQVRRFEGRGLIGEAFLLQNISLDPMVLAEPEFDREGGNVAGIAIEHHNLRPGDTTRVYVIRREDTP